MWPTTKPAFARSKRLKVIWASTLPSCVIMTKYCGEGGNARSGHGLCALFKHTYVQGTADFRHADWEIGSSVVDSIEPCLRRIEPWRIPVKRVDLLATNKSIKYRTRLPSWPSPNEQKTGTRLAHVTMNIQPPDRTPTSSIFHPTRLRIQLYVEGNCFQKIFAIISHRARSRTKKRNPQPDNDYWKHTKRFVGKNFSETSIRNTKPLSAFIIYTAKNPSITEIKKLLL